MKIIINQAILICQQVKWGVECEIWDMCIVIGISERHITYQNVNDENMYVWTFSLINNNPHNE